MKHLFYRQSILPTLLPFKEGSRQLRLYIFSSVIVLLVLFRIEAKAQTNPASITVTGACLNATYVLNKVTDNFEGTGKPAYLGEGSVTINSQVYTDNIAIYYEVAGPAWVLSMGGGQPYLSQSSNTALPPMSGWALVTSGSIGNCTGSAPLTVLTSPPSVTISPANPIAVCAGSPVSLAASASNIPTPVTYSWTSSPAGFSGSSSTLSQNAPSVSSNTTYTISVTANNGFISATSSVTLAVKPTPTLASTGSVNPSICSGSDGRINFTTTNISDGTYQLTFTGTGSPQTVTVTSNAFSLTGLSAGSYSAFAITNNGCTASSGTAVNLTSPTPTLTVSGSGSPTTCGGTNGTLSFTTTNLANGTYQLSYTGPGSPKTVTVNNNTFNLTGLGSGNYSAFTISNAVCSASSASSVPLTDPTPPTLVLGTPANPGTCNGSNGSISFTTNIVSGTYQLNYSGAGSPKTVAIVNNAFSLTGLSAGTYSNFSITRLNCTTSLPTSVTLSDPAAPTLAISTTAGPTTCAGTNGSISFSSTNLPDGTYQLSYTGAGTPKTVTVVSNAFSLTGLSAGSYSAFAITNNGCTATLATPVTLSDPAAPTLAISTTAGPTTCAGTNGSISFSSTNLPNGTYQLSYTGAGSPKTVTVVSNAFSLTGLSAGSYSAFAITNNGCTATLATPVTLSDPAAPTLAISTTAGPTTCAGTNGSISFSSTNLPNGTYQLSYTGAGSPKTVTVVSNAFSLTGLSAGSYSAFAITNNGCTATLATPVTLSDPAAPTLAISTTAGPTTCAGTNGSISFSSTNLPNGTYQLSYTGAGSPKTVTVVSNAFSLTGLSAGSYSAFAITNNGCTATLATPVTLSDPAAPTLAISTTAGPTICAGTNGSISFSSTNLPDGTYQLSYTGAGSPKTVTVVSNAFSLTGLGAGSYSAFSITNNGCTATLATPVTLSDPAAPTLAISTTAGPTTCAGTNGSISFSSTNLPDGTYQLSYSGSGSPKNVTVVSNAFSLTGLSAGSYSAFAITNNGCTATLATPVTLSDPAAPTLAISTTAGPTICAGTNGSISFSSTNLPDGTYQLSYTGAGSPKTVTVVSNAFSLTGLSAGSYSAFAITNNGCTATLATPVTLSDPAAPAATLSNNGPLTCNTPEATLTATGGVSYAFSNGATQVGGSTGNTATVNTPGTYFVIVTDANSCTALASTTVTSNSTLDAPSLVASSLTTTNQPISVSAIGCSGTINWNVTGGSGAANGSVYTFTQPGNYTLSASCTVGTCTSPVSQPVTVSILPGVFAITSVTTISCQVTDAARGRYSISFSPQYSGQNSNPISFSVVNEMPSTTAPGPYSLQLYQDNPIITLVANQAGNSEARFSYHWVNACQTGGSPNNPPTTSGILNQTITQGQAYQLNLNAYFSDPDQQVLTFSAQGLPAGLNLSGSVISGSPSNTGVSTVTITALDPGGLSASTSFTLSVIPTITIPGGNFAIANVTTVSCATVTAYERQLTFNPVYSGASASPISFSVVNELAPTTAPGPYTLRLYTDRPAITLQAMQDGQVSSYTYNWLAVCAGTPSGNTPPTVANTIAPQYATAGSGFNFQIPGTTFTDAETPNSLVLSVSGLPDGLSFIAPATISGTPSTTVGSPFTITVAATDPGGLSASTSFLLTINQGNTPGGSFAIANVTTVSCVAVTAGERQLTFNPVYTGVTGSPISFSVTNEMLPTTAPGPYTLRLYTDKPAITLVAVQNGTQVSYTYNWLAACNPGARQGISQESALQVNVLGNPIHGEEIELEVRGAGGSLLKVSVLSEIGRLTSERQIAQPTALERLTMKVGRDSGIYFLNVQSGSQQQVIKIIKE